MVLFLNSETKKEIFYVIIGSYSLMVILGLTWILGFFYFADGAEALAILFTITNSLQGVAIFVFHVLLHDKARFCLIENIRNIRRSLRNLKVLYYGTTCIMKTKLSYKPCLTLQSVTKYG